MNFNMKCDIERARGVYVGNIELSGVGRSGQKRVTDENFEAFLAKLKAAHDELLANVETYYKASEPSAPATHHSEAGTPAAPAGAPTPAAKGKARKASKPKGKAKPAGKKPAAKKGAAKAPDKKPAKAKPRKFAAE